MNINTQKLYLNRLGALHTILAAILVANSSAGRAALKQLVGLLWDLYGPMTPHLPVKVVSYDSPNHVDTGDADLSDAGQTSSPIAEFRNYKDFTVGEIADRAMERSGTHYIARAVSHLPRNLSSAFGCSQDPGFGLGCMVASVPEREQSWRAAILATKDEDRLAECARNGIKVIISRRTPVIDIDNLAGSTGKSAIVPNLLLGHYKAEQIGAELAPMLFGLLSSASVSGDPAAVRNNAAAALLETAFAASPLSGNCVLRTFDGREITYTRGPVLDAIIPVAISSEYQAASSRDQLALRVAFQVLVLLCTPAFLEIQKLVTDARRKAVNQPQDGFPFVWRLGLSRRFCSEELSKAVVLDEASRYLVSKI